MKVSAPDGLGFLDLVGQVGGAERIALADDDLEAGPLQHRRDAGGSLGAELVGDAEHHQLVVDLVLVLELAQHLHQRAAEIARLVEEEEQRRHLLDEIGGVVGVRRHRELRIAVARIDRRRRQVEAGAPGRQHEIDLVLGHQPLGEPYRGLGVAGVVVLDDLDRNSLVEFLDHQAALLVDVVHPQLVGGQRRHGGALLFTPLSERRNRS